MARTSAERLCRYCKERKSADAFPIISRGKHRRKDRRRDNRCLDCLRSIPLAALMLMHGGLCVLCGNEAVEPTLEHLTPISRGGRHEWSNVAVACRRCNVLKGQRTIVEWLMATGSYTEGSAKR